MTTGTSYSRWLGWLGAAALVVLPTLGLRPVLAADAVTPAATRGAAAAAGSVAGQPGNAARVARANSDMATLSTAIKAYETDTGIVPAAGAEASKVTSGTLSPARATTASAPVLASVGPSTATLAAEEQMFADENQIKLNFHNAQINTVLDYLARAAGFVIVRDTEPTGTVDAYSPRPLDKDEAVDLLNKVLAQKGYTAIRNERVLVIATRDAARGLDIPVIQGADPDKIPKSETIVTQIIPVKHANAMRLIDNLKPLLSATAVVTANESSNAILLTDSQVNTKRMVTIIKALDTAISEVATIKVRVLKYAIATSTADVINQLFQTPANGTNAIVRGIQRAAAGGRGGRGGGGGGGGGFMPGAMVAMAAANGELTPPGANASTGETGQSDARDAASRVQAVADDRTNAVIISAPEEIIPTIMETIDQLDVNTDEVTNVKVFFLQHADATDTANDIMSTFSGTGQTATSAAGQRGGAQQRGGMQRGPTAARGGAASSGQSARQAQANTVVATADLRTNSVIVTAGVDMMRQVEEIINSLDSDPAKNQTVQVFTLDHAVPADVMAILSSLFPAPQGSTANRNMNTNNRGTGATGGTNANNRGTGTGGRTGGTGSTGMGGSTSNFGGGGATRGN
jgi:general secretion pathway protein D